jgi:hypothetical protein
MSEVIIVTAQRLPYTAPPEWKPFWYYNDPSAVPGFGGVYDSAGVHHWLTEFEVQINLTFMPNEQQAATISAFRTAVEKARTSIFSLNDNAQVTFLNNNLRTTGFELKDLLKKTSITIDPLGTTYGPKAHIGEAIYNNGYPHIKLSLNALNLYGEHPAGLNTLILHEISHLVDAVRHFYNGVYYDADGYSPTDEAAHEQMAFDLSRAILKNSNTAYMAAPPGGYGADLTFSVPPGSGSEPPPEQPGPDGGHRWDYWDDEVVEPLGANEEGAETMTGGAGDDPYVDDIGDVVVETDQSNGINTVQSSVSFALGADQENLVLTGFEATTGTGNNLDNSITGNGAANVLNGGDGNDTLVGGVGSDTMTGGSGSDTFRFVGVGDSSGIDSDRISDFVSGIDKIDLGGIDADRDLTGDQSFTFIGTAAFTGTAGQLRHHSNGADAWLQADTDGDGIADFEVVLTGVTALSHNDFLL